MSSPSDRLKALLDRHGRTYCGELGFDIESGTPSALFQWLLASNLYSTRIGADLATAGARALFDEGLTTPQKLCDAGWEKRVKLLNGAGYARMDERYSAILGDMAEQILDRYDGDLRKLRTEAGRRVGAEMDALQELKGIGPSGADIFRREAQSAWGEMAPFLDKKAKSAAKDLDLPDDAEELADLAGGDFVRAAAALVRSDLEGDAEAIVKAA
ncbi:MAG: endonuclease [Oceanicaulis sp.]